MKGFNGNTSLCRTLFVLAGLLIFAGCAGVQTTNRIVDPEIWTV
jgi:uncharacterized lipoprotein YajG